MHRAARPRYIDHEGAEEVVRHAFLVIQHLHVEQVTQVQTIKRRMELPAVQILEGRHVHRDERRTVPRPSRTQPSASPDTLPLASPGRLDLNLRPAVAHHDARVAQERPVSGEYPICTHGHPPYTLFQHFTATRMGSIYSLYGTPPSQSPPRSTPSL